jgi:hypothetical protein
MRRKNLSEKKACSPSQLNCYLLGESRPGKKDHWLREIFCVGFFAKLERDLLESTIRGHGVDFLRGLSGEMNLGARTKGEV